MCVDNWITRQEHTIFGYLPLKINSRLMLFLVKLASLFNYQSAYRFFKSDAHIIGLSIFRRPFQPCKLDTERIFLFARFIPKCNPKMVATKTIKSIMLGVSHAIPPLSNPKLKPF